MTSPAPTPSPASADAPKLLRRHKRALVRLRPHGRPSGVSARTVSDLHAAGLVEFTREWRGGELLTRKRTLRTVAGSRDMRRAMGDAIVARCRGLIVREAAGLCSSDDIRAAEERAKARMVSP